MDPKNAIEIKNISKSFDVEVPDPNGKKNLLGKSLMVTTKKTIFDNLTLIVKKGEILGILGRNGAGKSTLLSLAAKIMEPDSGTVETAGNVVSILQLSMGFQSDMSGRENIYLKAQMHGMSKKEVDAIVEDVIDYAGIRDYIENPIRTYSSGMTSRLAFAIMVYTNIGILIADEVLSTGDIGFSTKASESFRKFLKDGKTVLFVSHDVQSVEQMCTRVIWIEKGKIIADGKPKQVCEQYQKKMTESFDVLYESAMAGVAESQYKIALMYRDGIETEKNEEQYREWLSKAAAQGHTLAQVRYADILFESDDDSKQALALTYYQSAAVKGNGDARTKITALTTDSGFRENVKELRDIASQLAATGIPGYMLKYGNLLLKTAWSDNDRVEAFGWIMKAADEGNPDAVMQIANMYLNGVGVAKSKKKYLEYLEKAADMHQTDAVKSMAEVCLQGKLIQKDEAKAFKYYMIGAEMGMPNMQYQIATMYRDGKGVEQDQVEADRWFAIYSNTSLVSFQMSLSESIGKYGVKTDATRESLILKAASTYSHKANLALADMYTGKGKVPVNVEKAREYYDRTLIWPGKPRADVAELYYNGFVYPMDKHQAGKLYQDTAYMCSGKVDYKLYQMYSVGELLEKNDDLAMKHLKRAAVKGNAEALAELEKKEVNGE